MRKKAEGFSHSKKKSSDILHPTLTEEYIRDRTETM